MTKHNPRTYAHYANCYYPALSDYKAGMSQSAIARKYKINQCTVSDWVNEKKKPRWLHKIDPVLRYTDDGQLVTHQTIDENSTKEKKVTNRKKKETTTVTIKEPSTKTIFTPELAIVPSTTPQKGHLGSHLLIMFLYFVVTVLACIAIINLHKLF